MADIGTGITYRQLPVEEYDRLIGLGPNDDWIPIPENGRVLVAEKDGQIVGFCALQIALHIDPLWVKDGEANGMTGARLWNMAVENLKENHINVFYVFAETGIAAGYLERLGLKRLPFIPYAAGY